MLSDDCGEWLYLTVYFKPALEVVLLAPTEIWLVVDAF
jgi:hypothetical protein